MTPLIASGDLFEGVPYRIHSDTIYEKQSATRGHRGRLDSCMKRFFLISPWIRKVIIFMKLAGEEKFHWISDSVGLDLNGFDVNW